MLPVATASKAAVRRVGGHAAARMPVHMREKQMRRVGRPVSFDIWSVPLLISVRDRNRARLQQRTSIAKKRRTCGQA